MKINMEGISSQQYMILSADSEYGKAPKKQHSTNHGGEREREKNKTERGERKGDRKEPFEENMRSEFRGEIKIPNLLSMRQGMQG